MTTRQKLSHRRVGLANPDDSDTLGSNAGRGPASIGPQDCASARPKQRARQRQTLDTTTTAPSEDTWTGGVTSYAAAASAEDWRRRAGGQKPAGGVPSYTAAALVEDWRRCAAAPVEDRSLQTSREPAAESWTSSGTARAQTWRA